MVRLEVPPLRDRREEIPPLVHHFLAQGRRESQKTGLRLAEDPLEYLVLYRWPGNIRSRRTIPASDRTIAPTEFVVRIDPAAIGRDEHLERSMVLYALKRVNHARQRQPSGLPLTV